jgi:alpha-galactosidase
MSEALKKSGRDIHYSISNSAPFAYAKDWARLTNSYRTGPDIRDSWLSLYISSFENERWNPFVGPGHWADPDMMIVGNVTTGTDMHPTRLTPDEQYSHVSLFSLLAAPLLIGCPIDQLDDFTLNLLSNDEVIEINQDPLGKPADKVTTKNGVQVWLKKLSNGDFALGLFNVSNWGDTPDSFFRWGDEKDVNFKVKLSELGLQGTYVFRDVWRQKDISKGASWSGQIPHHGVKFFRLTKR